MDTNDMGEFLNKMATQFVSLSAQSQELAKLKPEMEHLQQSMDTLRERITHLEGRNTGLSDDLQVTLDTVSRLERERDAAQAELGQVTNERDNAENVAREHEASIASLQEELSSVKAALGLATSERDAAVVARDQAASQREATENDYFRQAEQLDYWKGEATRHETAHKEQRELAEGLQYQLTERTAALENMTGQRDTVAAKLDAIQSVFRGVFEPQALRDVG